MAIFGPNAFDNWVFLRSEAEVEGTESGFGMTLRGRGVNREILKFVNGILKFNSEGNLFKG